MAKFSASDISDFHKALGTARDVMSADQQQLLDAVLLLAWTAVEDEDKLSSGFSGSFTPEQASLLTQLTAGELSVRPQLFRGFIRLG